MSKETLDEAKREIAETLILNTFCMKRIGISFEVPETNSAFLRQKIMFMLSVWTICYHVFSEFIYIALTLSESPKVEEVVPLFHTFGYGALSIAKLFVLWYKKDVFRKLINELATIWPMPPIDREAQMIKNKSIAALRIAHRWYFTVNILGVWFYNLTPIAIYFYHKWMGPDVRMGYVWASWYPFDKHKTIAHVAVYIFEIIAGQTSVFIMVGTDLLFSGMASHIGLLLKLLHRQLETWATRNQDEQTSFKEILDNIKLHQRLIRYCNDLQVAFSLSNLVNIILSSVNICCVVFVIVLLEPFLAVSNKLFLGSALIQIGMLCWYADDIFHANADVSSAAYNSGWYNTSPRCRRCLLFLIQRAQKPIAFSAMGFTDISLATYSSIPECKFSNLLTKRAYAGNYATDFLFAEMLYRDKDVRQSKSNQTDSIQNFSLPSTPHERDTLLHLRTPAIHTYYEYKNESKKSMSKSSRQQEIDDSTKSKICNSNKVKYYPLHWSSEDICEGKDTIHLPKLNANEKAFIQLVVNNNVEDLKNFLKEHKELNINCIDYQGVSALHIAVRNRSKEIVEILLQQPHIDIGDTALQAVKNTDVNILVMLLDAQKKISPGLEFAGASHSTEFPGHVTPLLLAAQYGHYEMVTLLLSRGHTITKPHPPNCFCVTCKNSLLHDDHLYESMSRLSLYRALASPAYIVHLSPDPILTALCLAAELAENAAANRQLEATYIQLGNDVSAFAVDLIGCCRTSEEVEMVLKQNTGCRGQRHFVLPRLLMAVNYKQKEFVAHPNTQQVLESYWLGDWYSWKYKSTLSKAAIVVTRVFLMPVILLMCMVLPRHRLVTRWQIPLNKLITHAAAYIVFLSLVFFISNQDKTAQKRGPPDTGAETPLILYVCGYTWSAMRMCVMQGPRRYFTAMWNWAEIIMLALFCITFFLWVAAAVEVASADDNLERKFWDQHDPTLLAEGTFCLATIFAYSRLMYLCQLNYHLGPLQVSLGKMTIDIYKYIIVFAIIISAFSAGLARLYQYYDGMVYEDEFGVKTAQVSSFTSLIDTLKTLFWGLFCMAPLESADVVLTNTRSSKNIDKVQENRHGYTELIGYFCFGCFEVISVIVVLNMLIATMSNTFQKVNDNVAIEWTFGRTEVYIEYMLQTTLPSPFNLIPTASGMGNAVEWVRAKISKPQGVYARWSPSYCCYMDRDIEISLQKEFPALMSVLVQRYFKNKQTSKSRVEAELEAVRQELATYKEMTKKKIKTS